MAFTRTITLETVFGNKKIRAGTYTSDSGSTGGELDTGLTDVEGLTLQPSGAAVATNAPVYNETLPISGPVTIVTDADEVGTWFAWGN